MIEKKIQLVIPMAGLGLRFRDEGYEQPKPLIPIHGMPMIKVVLGNLLSEAIGHVILVALREVTESVDLRELVGSVRVPLTIVSLDRVTEGPADTVKAAKSVINNSYPLVIANSDQYVDSDLNSFYETLLKEEDSGAILTMQDDDPKWSYVEIDQDGTVINVREKEVISNHATVGIYGFSRAGLAWDAFEQMWQANEKVNGEYYVAPSYNYLAKKGIKIHLEDLGPVQSVMYGLGIPKDLNDFLKTPLSRNAVEKSKIKFNQIL